MKYSTDLLLSALVLVNSKLKSAKAEKEDICITSIQFHGLTTKFKARYIRSLNGTNHTEGDIYFNVTGGNRITTFTQIDDNLSVE